MSSWLPAGTGYTTAELGVNLVKAITPKVGVFSAAGGSFTGGLNARILDNVMLGAAISTTFGKKQGNETSGHLGLKVGL